MIKIDGNSIYMASGDVCYIMRLTDRGLEHVCFGKRAEQEDDLAALGICAGELELGADGISVMRDKKKPKLELKYKSAAIMQKPRAPIPTLGGGETLKTSYEDSAAGVLADVYYTTYIRGGVAKRVELRNIGKTPLTVSACDIGRIAHSPVADGAISFKDCRGGCYGEYVFAPAMGAVTVEPGMTYYAPELLCVYSDVGRGGVVRAYHDILREYGGAQNRGAGKRPIVLYCEQSDDYGASAEAASDTGIDTFAVELGKHGKTELNALAAKVRECGMKFGLKIPVKDGSESVFDIIADCGAEYVELYYAGGDAGGFCGAYGLFEKVAAEFPSVYVEWAGGEVADGSATEMIKARAYSPLPPAFVRNTVKLSAGSLKTAYDIATLGGLGYEFDPAVLPQGAKRAVRAQVFSYQDDAALIADGDVYDVGGGIMVVAKDKSKAYVVATGSVLLCGLDENNLYHVRELDKTFSGAALSHYGIATADGDETFTYHIRQVADYDR